MSGPINNDPRKVLTRFHQKYDGLPGLKTVIDDLKGKEIHDPNFGHYKTNHKIDYPGYGSGLYADAHRPPENGTAKSIKPPADSEFTTTVQENFSWKKCEKQEPIRSGTASGQRRNNPHPHEVFMTWKLNKRKIYRETENLGAQDDKELQTILRDQITSTYQNAFHDNTGKIKEMRVKAAEELKEWENPTFASSSQSTEPTSSTTQCGPVPKEIKNLQKNWRSFVGQEFDQEANLSTNTVTYGRPVHHKHLDDNTTRYGCNRKKMKAAIGAVPTVIKHNATNQSPTLTSYQSQFQTGKKGQ